MKNILTKMMCKIGYIKHECGWWYGDTSISCDGCGKFVNGNGLIEERQYNDTLYISIYNSVVGFFALLIMIVWIPFMYVFIQIAKHFSRTVKEADEYNAPSDAMGMVILAPVVLISAGIDMIYALFRKIKKTFYSYC